MFFYKEFCLKTICFTDTSIAELVKEYTDTDEFIDCLRCQQGIDI